MNQKNTVSLSIMMFLQFFIWGAWYGQMGKFMGVTLGSDPDSIGKAYASFSIAMIAAPFFIGLISDRYFNGEKVLAVLNILGAVALYFLSKETNTNNFLFWILIYCLIFGPTIALTSSIAMTHMDNPSKQFPVVRVFGTIGWFVVVNIIGWLKYGDKSGIFSVAMVASVIAGLFAFFLPKTPPKIIQKPSFSQIIGADAFVLFKDKSFLIFFVSSILVCIPLSFYYAFANSSLTDAGMQNVENKMTLGLISEFVFMLAIPFALRRFGVKWIMIVGLLGWIIRFILFGTGTASTEWILLLAITLHGLCYDFFFVTGQIYAEGKAGEKIKSQAQSLMSIATYGIGMYIGSRIAGVVVKAYTIDNVTNWSKVWTVPAIIAGVVLVLFLLFFKGDSKITEKV